MAASTVPVDVCNLALLYAGSTQEINTLEENTAEARACKRLYSRVRDQQLERFPWRFATLRADLALLTGEERSGWTYAYACPSKMLTPQFIYAGTMLPREEDKIPFDIEALDAAGTVNGKVLLTDHEAPELVYTAECENVALWTPTFVELVAWELAVKLCLALPVKPEWAQRAKVGAIEAFAQAGAAQLRARHQGPEPRSTYTSAR